MATTPPIEDGSDLPDSHSIQSGKDAASAERTSRPQGVSVSAKGAQRKVVRSSQASSGKPVVKKGLVNQIGKSRKPAVAERDIAEWLGISELADETTDEESTEKTQSAVAPRRKVSAAIAETNEKTIAVSNDSVLSSIADRLVERNVPSFVLIGTDIKSGTITAKGNVASQGERLLLIHILQTTPGIQKVNDELVVGRAIPEAPRVSARVLSKSSTSTFSLPTLSLPSMSSLTEGFSSVNPKHAGIAAASLLLIAFFFWPRGISRPVAVHPVKGRVLLEGKPLADATVVLHPVGDSKLPRGLLPRGTAEEDGAFVLKTYESADGAPDGEFVATVHLIKPVLVEGDMVPGPDLSPAVYRSPETSPIRLKITRETKEISLLELHKANDTQSNN